MSILDLIEQVKLLEDCDVRPPNGQPVPMPGHVIPDDLAEFYEYCGGLTLFRSSSYPVNIVDPTQVIQSNPVILGIPAEDDLSFSWYIFADNLIGDYFTIDLSPDRLGRCYDSYFDSHAMPGTTKIIAVSFTDFINRMIVQEGGEWYFGTINFGDAYEIGG